MPIGLVSDEDFERELRGVKRVSSTSPKVEVIDAPSRGRSNGDVNVPDSLRKIIGEDALLNGRSSAVALAESFGISPSSASAYARGATSTTTYNSPKPSIISHINKSKERAVKKAQKTLNAALGSITQEKLDYADVKDLSGIAKDMSVIIKNLEPQTNSTSEAESRGPQFVIFAPQFRQENSFESITVNE